ncbi:hypothetical protein [Tenacibaculum sp. 190524A02b]|uniref:hypothetical protein n=1 Tax=Tenacibaculum vairaonense TaxID=3137860 RepID=UPI0031FA9017
MNKFIFTIYLFLIGTGIAMAQDIELFRFSNLQLAEGKTMVLHHNKVNNKVTLIEKSEGDFGVNGGFLQAFILKRLTNGKVLIASAKQKNYFLRYKPSTDEVDFALIENKEVLENYTWQLQFAGKLNNNNAKNIIAISPTSVLSKGLVHKSNNQVGVETLKANPTSSGRGGTIIGNQYRFTMEKLADVL